MDFPFGEMVTVRTVVTVVDDYGNESTTTEDADWGPVAVWDRFADEDTDPHAPRVVVGLSLAGPRRVFDSDDLIVRGGVVYQVEGLPLENTRSPFTGWDPGVVVNVVRAAAV